MKTEEFDAIMSKADRQIKLAADLEKLSKNPQFRRVIEEAYLQHEAARLARAYNNSNLSDQAREQVMRDMCGIGALVEFFRTIERDGESAVGHRENAIHEREEFIREIDGEV